MTTVAHGQQLLERGPNTLPFEVKAGLVMAMVVQCEGRGLAPPGIALALHDVLRNTPKALRAYRRALQEVPPLDVEICKRWERTASKYLDATQSTEEPPAAHDTPPPPGSGFDEEEDAPSRDSDARPN